MNRKQCKEALDIYKKFLVRMDKTAEFLKVAEVWLTHLSRVWYCSCTISANYPDVARMKWIILEPNLLTWREAIGYPCVTWYNGSRYLDGAMQTSSYSLWCTVVLYQIFCRYQTLCMTGCVMFLFCSRGRRNRFAIHSKSFYILRYCASSCKEESFPNSFMFGKFS